MIEPVELPKHQPDVTQMEPVYLWPSNGNVENTNGTAL